MDPRLLKVIGELATSPGMSKMAQISAKATELGLDEEHVGVAVQAICRLVTSNLQKKDELREFVNHVVDGAIEGGPELLEAIAKLTNASGEDQ